ncbi:hypothetical protein NECAME_12908 [Necator americanus]|uniref:Uncharacterized protein n=1 Tax=Necator americanus TaxID=51031 RepID=W2SY48_NECAM|nr:hypothetical protein NECAME_12908 [Necator americanus]ETN74565.1 hypothetical protein NECAME_12908 [Necator americanus]
MEKYSLENPHLGYQARGSKGNRQHNQRSLRQNTSHTHGPLRPYGLTGEYWEELGETIIDVVLGQEAVRDLPGAGQAWMRADFEESREAFPMFPKCQAVLHYEAKHLHKTISSHSNNHHFHVLGENNRSPKIFPLTELSKNVLERMKDAERIRMSVNHALIKVSHNVLLENFDAKNDFCKNNRHPSAHVTVGINFEKQKGAKSNDLGLRIGKKNLLRRVVS